jgi:preprotein translocase subunit SecG
MGLLISILTLILVVNSLFLMLLILVQLPKKDAGAGLAFGAATSDALFGAGSGTVLTRLSKYLTAGFLALSVIVAVMRTHHAKSAGRSIASEIDRQAAAAAATAAAAAATPAPGTTTSNLSLPLVPNLSATSALVTPAPAVTATAAPVPAVTNKPNPAPEEPGP